MDKLKPCPFCGEQPIIAPFHKHYLGTGDTIRFTIYCRNRACLGYLIGAWFDTEQEAIEAWNTRKGENQIENNIRAVAEVLGLNKGEENG